MFPIRNRRVGMDAGPIGQPWLTVMIDYFCRMIVGFCLGFEPPSQAVIMEALRHAILPKLPCAHACIMGPPPDIVPDMAKKQTHSLVPAERIEKAILFVRGQKVMLDRDLAELYEVETRVLVQAVKRNIKRFPSDFMFQLNKEEFDDWRSQFVMSNPSAKMSLRRRPYAFTEQGVAMLSRALTPSPHPHTPEIRASLRKPLT